MRSYPRGSVFYFIESMAHGTCTAHVRHIYGTCTAISGVSIGPLMAYGVAAFPTSQDPAVLAPRCSVVKRCIMSLRRRASQLGRCH